MSIIDSVKNTAFSTAVKTVMDYLEKDPEKNIPKAMSMMDKVLPDGWYEGQRAAFRKAIAEKGNWYQLIMKAYQLDAGVRKTFFQNFIVNSALKGSAIQNEIRERENCNVPWAVLLDPTSACNLHCTGCCLLYLPQTLRRTKHGSREEAVMMAQHIQRLICSTYGHTLVLFTSYSLMGSVYQILRDSLPFPMVEVWRNAQEEIMRFKTMENAVLFAAGSCWEGVDFPGDIVSSLIIVKLPFAVPDPLREAEKERYATLTEYIRDIIVPDMQKKLRQGFGRAIRTESDTCVVSILDHRAVAGGRYHEDVLCALPACQMAETIEDVETFIRRQKCEEYYM